MSWLHKLLGKLFTVRDQQQDGDVVKPFLEHLEDLRWTIVKAASALIVGMIIAFIWVKEIVAVVRAPLEALQGKDPLITLGVTDAFMISLQMAFYAGIVLAFPLIIYFIAEFVLPALTRQEKKMLVPGIAVGFVLFGAGVYLAYEFVLPLTLKWFRDYAVGLGMDPRWVAREYFAFVTHLTIACGLLGELPVVVIGLSLFGFISFKLLSATRNYAYTLILILVAIISPTPDPMTFLIMSIPVLAIYETCIWLVWLIERRKATNEISETNDYH